MQAYKVVNNFSLSENLIIEKGRENKQIIVGVGEDWVLKNLPRQKIAELLETKKIATVDKSGKIIDSNKDDLGREILSEEEFSISLNPSRGLPSVLRFLKSHNLNEKILLRFKETLSESAQYLEGEGGFYLGAIEKEVRKQLDDIYKIPLR